MNPWAPQRRGLHKPMYNILASASWTCSQTPACIVLFVTPRLQALCLQRQWLLRWWAWMHLTDIISREATRMKSPWNLTLCWYSCTDRNTSLNLQIMSTGRFLQSTYPSNLRTSPPSIGILTQSQNNSSKNQGNQTNRYIQTISRSTAPQKNVCCRKTITWKVLQLRSNGLILVSKPDWPHKVMDEIESAQNTKEPIETI